MTTKRSTPEYDLRLSRYLGTSTDFWLRLRLDFELMRAEREKGERISRTRLEMPAMVKCET